MIVCTKEKQIGINDVVIKAERAEIEERSMGGTQVATIEILDGDQYTRYFVRVGYKNGRSFAEIATNKKETTTRKSVFGLLWPKK